MKIKYRDMKIGAARMKLIEQSTAICEEYAAQGLNLTLRQVYYQHVARDLLGNKQSNYKMLGEALNDGRMAGLFDWDYIIDRTRNLVDLPHWADPAAIIRSAAEGYRTDRWAVQRERVEVWIEKDAGIGVIEAVCRANDVPYFSCRGYTSASELWAAGQRVGDHLRRGARVTILHVGDHDPSGLDMTRDVNERMAAFLLEDWRQEFGLEGAPARVVRQSMRDGMRQLGKKIEDEDSQGREVAPWRVRRIALNKPQIDRYQPPPNPAKTTDSRFERYVQETGLDESWELDALDPRVLQDLIQGQIEQVRNEGLWDESTRRMERERALLTDVSADWANVSARYQES